jgi:hypothetical protein
LVGANGKPIPTFKFDFLLATVAMPLLGMDFLSKFGLSIVPDKQQVLNAATGRTFTKSNTASFNPPWDVHTAAAVAALPQQVQALLAEFPTLVRPSNDPPKPLHGVVHQIDTGSAAPMFARPRQLDPEKHRIAEAKFWALEKAGIICRSKSP